MKYNETPVVRRVLLLAVVVVCLPTGYSCLTPNSLWAASEILPFPSTSRELSSHTSLQGSDTRLYSQLQEQKLRVIPGKIVQTTSLILHEDKERLLFTRRDNRRKIVPRPPLKPNHTGLLVELEAAYGLYDTVVGRFQHGTQLPGAHYYLQGHWEKTRGEVHDRSEEILVGGFTSDADFSPNVNVLLEGSYFESSADLRQLEGVPQHNKADIEARLGMKINFRNYTHLEWYLSGEQARFTDESNMSYDMNRYGAIYALKRFWSPKNTLNIRSAGWWDEYFQEDRQTETRYYGTSSVINSFVLRNILALDTGVQFDYSYSEERGRTDYAISPVATTRIRLFRNTTLYVSYHPSLKFPDFRKLYIKKLYTTVNPDLRPETIRHDVESGINQGIGDVMSLNIAVFFRESEDVILQIDDNNDNILEYTQPYTAQFMGVKANVQMNFAEQFVQTITYTYTDYELLASSHTGMLPQEEAVREVLPYLPNHQIQASVYWMTPLGFAIDFNGIYVSEQYRNRQSSQPHIGKRFFLNIEFIQKISDRFQLFLLGRNLTNTDTYDIIPILDSEEIASSRLFFGGVRFRF